MIRQKIKIAARGLLLMVIAVVLVICDPAVMALAAPIEGDKEHKGDSFYYTQNGIIFYDGGQLYCSAGGGAVSGGAAGALQKQRGLGGEWVPVILNAAKEAGADPIAMASLLFWENRGFPAFDATWGGSDSIGRGPWQITKATWPSSAGPYSSGVIDPKISTTVAADIVKSYGGEAGIAIGSIDQDFSKGSKIKSMATLAKNYNAGRATWRNPGVASFKTDGRVWMNGSNGAWFSQKQEIIDEYILAMTYAYYLIATGQSLPAKGELNNDAFVKRAQQNAQAIKDFKVTDGANAANECTDGGTAAGGNGDIVKTALSLAWPNTKYDGIDRKSAAKPSFQKVMPQVEGNATANSVDGRGRTAWSDCGVFVATVMRYSGADPKYDLRDTGTQLAYVRNNRDKFDILPNLNNTSQLKPGDVFIIDGHTFLYVGKYKGDDGKTYDSASASFGDHTPMASHAYFSDSRGHYTVARLKTTNSAPATAVGGQ